MQNYRARAEEQALLAFWNLDRSIQDKIFVDNKNVIRFLQKYKNAIQQNTKRVPKKHLKVLLEKAFTFLPADVQCNLLCFELYEVLEISRQKLTKKRVFSIDEAFDLYSDYLSFVYSLHKYPSKWFAHIFKEIKNDWLEVVEVVKFITTTRLRASALHFRKDLQIIADNSEKISAKIVYAVDFLGIEVHIKKTSYSLDRLYAFDEFPIPAVAGKFAETLRSSIFEALNNTQYQLAIQEMQEGLLAHDFGIALTHYKESKPLFNKVDFSFSLKGGAGSVSMNIKTWASLGKRVLAPIRNLFTVKQDVSKTSPAISIVAGIFFVLLGGGIVWWAKFADKLKEFIPLLVLGVVPVLILLLLVVLVSNARQFKIIKIDGEEVLVNRTNRTYIPQNIKIQQLDTYEYILEDRKQAFAMLQKSENVIENVYGKLCVDIQKIAKEYIISRIGNVRNYMSAPDVLTVYAKAFSAITQKRGGYADVVRYILLKRIKKSIQDFVALALFATEHQINPFFYVTLFNYEFHLDTGKKYIASEISYDSRILCQHIDKEAVYPIIEEEALQAFMAGKLQELKDDNFAEDLEEIKHNHQHKKTFLLEGEEIVAKFGHYEL